MKHIILLLFLLIYVLSATAQPAGYYNGTSGKTGEELKGALHEIIKGHVDFTYSFSKNIFKYSDQDPQNTDNVILFYTRRSQANDDYGTDGNYINREHVWAKSHGGFADIRPMDSDVHNLHPADASVNQARSNKDFDDVTGGTLNSESGAEYNSTSWEPSDTVKGRVARTILYMAIRYEGTDGEIDLEAVDEVDTYPAAEHGKLSTLLEWNRNFPPDAFERRRNDRIFEVQRNRNPFIDNPGFADLIWGEQAAETYRIGDVTMTPVQPVAGDGITLSAAIEAPETPDLLKAYWGTTYDSEGNSVDLVQDGGVYTATIPTTAFQEEDTLYYKLVVSKADVTNLLRGSYCFPKNIPGGELSAIEDIQGTGSASPLNGQEVTIAGRVTANFDDNFYIQSGKAIRSGICVYNEIKKGKVGDSIVVTATVDEFNGLTEVTTPSYLYVFNDNQEINPVTVAAADIDEDYEGMLVTINNQQINTGDQAFQAGKNYNLLVQGVELRVQYDSRLIDKRVPDETVNITGVIGEYNGTYQIMPRDENDIEIVTSSTGNQEFAQHKILLYPNPAAEKVFIRAVKPVKNVTLIDIAGCVVQQHYVGEDKAEVSLDGLQNGIYLVKIQYTDADLQVRRLVIRK